MILSQDRYVPERQCAGCGKRAPKDSLIRICIGEDGLPAPDTSYRMQRRGVYICRNAECLEKAVRRKAFSRLPGTAVRNPDPEKLKGQLLELIGNER